MSLMGRLLHAGRMLREFGAVAQLKVAGLACLTTRARKGKPGRCMDPELLSHSCHLQRCCTFCTTPSFSSNLTA